MTRFQTVAAEDVTHDPEQVPPVVKEQRVYGSNWSDGAGGDGVTGAPEVFGHRLLVGRVNSRRKRCVQDNRIIASTLSGFLLAAGSLLIFYNRCDSFPEQPSRL